MRILFLTHYFPPEVNAPASRTYENAKRWVQAGHDVTVITCAPNHPNGVVYPGFRNRCWQWEEMDCLKVLRVKTCLSPNKETVRRIMNYLSYLVAATLLSPLTGKADVVVSTSPQFFCGLAGAGVSRLKGAPWVLEIRDLWPESIAAVEAISNPRIIGALSKVETWMYRNSQRIVSVTDSFVPHFVKRGIPRDRVSVIKNGADITRFSPAGRENRFRLDHGLQGKFVASYVGTHGMAHGLDTIFIAAQRLKEDDRIRFLLVGDGAEREDLIRKKDHLHLGNVIMLPQMPKEMMPEILAASDASLVLLRKAELFKAVIPSKIFEAMAMERPIVLGVEGESKRIIEKGRCGLCIEPENPEALAEAILRLADDQCLVEELGQNGRKYVSEFFNRDILAANYLAVLAATANSHRSLPRAGHPRQHYP